MSRVNVLNFSIENEQMKVDLLKLLARTKNMHRRFGVFWLLDDALFISRQNAEPLEDNYCFAKAKHQILYHNVLLFIFEVCVLNLQ